MTPSELELAATAAGLLLILIGSITWVVYDGARRRQKRKRYERKMERYDRWIDAQTPVLIAKIDELLSRIEAARLKYDRLRQFYGNAQTGEYWEQWFEETWNKHHAHLKAGGRVKRQKIDGHIYYQED